jgi:hypothetical protein
MLGHVEVEDAAAVVGEHDKDEEDAQLRGGDREEIDRDEVPDMLARNVRQVWDGGMRRCGISRETVRSSARSTQGVAQASAATGVMPATRGAEMAQPEYLALREIALRAPGSSSREAIPAVDRSTRWEHAPRKQPTRARRAAPRNLWIMGRGFVSDAARTLRRSGKRHTPSQTERGDSTSTVRPTAPRASRPASSRNRVNATKARVSHFRASRRRSCAGLHGSGAAANPVHPEDGKCRNRPIGPADPAGHG